MKKKQKKWNAGKTTTTAKLAGKLKRIWQGKEAIILSMTNRFAVRVAKARCDVYRPDETNAWTHGWKRW